MRRRVSDLDILGMVLRNWHAGPPMDPSVTRTGAFLWLLVAITVIGVAIGAWSQRGGQREQDCNHHTGTSADIECAQRGEAQAGREGDDVGHPAIVIAQAVRKYVRRSAA